MENCPRRKFLLQKLHPFYKKMSVYFPIRNTVRKQWANFMNYKPFRRGCGSYVILKDIVTGLPNYAEQN